jgi:hypothetical protein
MDEIWLDEPDEKDWEYKGFKCALRRNHCGSWCGYVGISKEHPLYGLGYDDVSDVLVAMLEAMKNKPVPKEPSFSLLISILGGEIHPTPANVIQVHGGITYAGDGKDLFNNPDIWFFGFDCSHAGDYAPNMPVLSAIVSGNIYRDIDYATAEAEKMADQLAVLMVEPLDPSKYPPFSIGKCDIF